MSSRSSERKCSLQERLAAQPALLGLLQLCPDAMLVKSASQCGYDFLVLDAEHGVFSEDDYLQTLTVLGSAEVLGMVRLAAHDAQALRRYAEMGASAIIVPHISTAEEARVMVQAMPAHSEATLIVILESSLGASHAEEILAIDGIGGALVGPTDLTTDLGCKGDYTHAAYVQALSRIERAAASTGKLLGTVPHGHYSLERLFQQGHRLLILGTDRSLLREAMSAQVAKARSVLPLNHWPTRNPE